MTEHQASRLDWLPPYHPTKNRRVDTRPTRVYTFDLDDAMFVLRVASELGCSEDEALHGILREARALVDLDGVGVVDPRRGRNGN